MDVSEYSTVVVEGIYAARDDTSHPYILLQDENKKQGRIYLEDMEAFKLFAVFNGRKKIHYALSGLPHEFVYRCAMSLRRIILQAFDECFLNAILDFDKNISTDISHQAGGLTVASSLTLALALDIDVFVKQNTFGEIANTFIGLTADAADAVNVAKKCDINLVVAEYPFPFLSGGCVIKGSDPGKLLLHRYLPVLACELRLYPMSLFKMAKISKIIVCANLYLNAKKLSGCVILAEEAIFLEANYINSNLKFVRETIHHEIFHFLDVVLLQGLSPYEEWVNSNKPGFQYGAQPVSELSSASYWFDHDPPKGFSHEYGMSNILEDRATVFASLMTDKENLYARCLNDPVLRTKCEMMERAISAIKLGLP